MRSVFLSAPVVAAALALSPAAFAGPASAQEIDAAVTKAAAEGFTGQVLASDRTTTTFDRVVGVPAPDLWIWGSVTKQVAAVMTLQAVERGELALTDTIAARLPDFSNADTGSVTVEELLRHISGLPKPDVDSDDFFRRNDPAAGTAADALGFCAGPSTGGRGAFTYNNCDTLVLGAILQRATGRTFAELLAERIARPAGLETLRLARSGEAFAIQPDPSIQPAAYGFAAGLVGSAEDLMRFDRALMGEVLLSDAYKAVLWNGDPALGYVALGAWGFEAPLAGCDGPVRLIERRGAVAGVQVRNLIAPDRGRALVVFTGDPELEFGEIWMGAGLTHDLAAAAICSD